MGFLKDTWNTITGGTQTLTSDIKNEIMQELLSLIDRAIPLLDGLVPFENIDFFETINSLLDIDDFDTNDTIDITQPSAPPLTIRNAINDQKELKLSVKQRSTSSSTTKDVAQSPSRKLIFESPPILDQDAINKDIKFYRITHITVTIFISGISMLVETLSLGQIDRIPETLSLIYNLTPSSLIYDQALAIEQEAKLMRPYRYLTEAKHTSVIPPTSDLITFLVREQMGNSFEEGLANFTRMMKFQGFDEFWSQAYWNSHWILPNTSELFEMFGRGIIDLDELKLQLQINDIKPIWIDRIIQLAERLPSRTEARMINRTRRMTQDQIDKIIKAERINDEYKDDFRFFIENQELDTINLRIIREQTELYTLGLITTDEFRNLLQGSILSDLEIQKSIELADLVKRTEIAKRDIQTFKLWSRNEIKNNNADQETIRSRFAEVIKDTEILDSYVDQEFARAKRPFDIEDLES